MFLILSFYLFMFNILTWLLFIYFLINKIQIILEWSIFFNNSLNFNFTMFFDFMTFLFFSTVSMISSMVILYSISYMNNDLNIKRFMLMILTFIFSMFFMIMSPNLISILLGWDGLGLSSYCLVAYYSSKKSFNSSMTTILMNRIGDIMILSSIGLISSMGSMNFLNFFKLDELIMYFIMTASITKSAQIPFSAWLPLAMAAPTPVSSLVHSSTLVTAGVYLLIRFNYLMSTNFMYFLMMLSCVTMTMAGSSANLEFDLKKIIALSTLSQLGIMIFTISLNNSILAFFHLISHAMFKSLLFLCSGIIIHNQFNNQDIRFISFMNNNMPMINMILNIASLTLCGMPFLSGFYSKDLIIEIFLMNKYNWISFFLMFLAMSLTTSYTFRLMFYISIKFLKMNMFNLFKLKDFMIYSIIILLLMSLFYGSMINWIFFSSINLIFLPKKLKILIYYFLILSMILSMYLSKIKMNFLSKFKFIIIFLNLMWFFSILWKKNKMNLYILNNKIYNKIEINWTEIYMNDPMNFYISNNFNLKKINKTNFLIMFMSFMYMMMIYLYT